MDMQHGLVCSLTGERADFESDCSDFQADEKAAVKQAANKRMFARLTKIRGWLAIFLWVGILGSVVFSAVDAIMRVLLCYFKVNIVRVFFGERPAGSLFADFAKADQLPWYSGGCSIVLDLLLCIIGIYTIRAFYNRKSNAVAVAMIYMVMCLLIQVRNIFEIGAMGCSALTALGWILSLLIAGIGLLFLFRSDRVAAMFPEKTRTCRLLEQIAVTLFLIVVAAVAGYYIALM